MAGYTEIVAGNFKIYSAAAGTNFPGAWPVGDAAPTGYTPVGTQLISAEGITKGLAYTTNLEHVLAWAGPVAENLESIVYTISFECLDMTQAFQSFALGNPISSGGVSMEPNVGPLPEAAFIIIGPGPAEGKRLAWWLPRATIKIDGDTVFMAGGAAKTPVTLTPLHDPTDGMGTYHLEP